MGWRTDCNRICGDVSPKGRYGAPASKSKARSREVRKPRLSAFLIPRWAPD
jgi:hypothetical protein